MIMKCLSSLKYNSAKHCSINKVGTEINLNSKALKRIEGRVETYEYEVGNVKENRGANESI